MAGVAGALAAEFGLAEVATWRWGVFTEYNNQDWLRASAAQIADLYDFTVCGLERALGSAALVDVGVHAALGIDEIEPTMRPSFETPFNGRKRVGAGVFSGGH